MFQTKAKSTPSGASCRGILLVSLSLLFTGCGEQSDRPDLGEVEGIITIDGKPVPDLQVIFYQQGYPESIGVTNDDGSYQLKYIRDAPGAAVGKHEVRIRRTAGGDTKASRPLPTRYNLETELEADVKLGSNVINFDLTTEESQIE